ncbi:tail assembly protein [Pseudomonas phage PspYZU01]|uniref:Virion structural protein n=1 Tax=Pseudomonas phage PspYZU01 TaxID=1983555 RepID=A0A2U7NLN6_9CAUD|nr:tail assembly protein [Pseudomonas phage PspYZU01]ASD51918.1 hypothetical protein PspYZU01_33 [Pseudomonas phage PspYZU01]
MAITLEGTGTMDRLEASRHDARPVHLYRFLFGPAPEDHYGFTDAEQPITHDQVIHKPMAVTSGEVSQNGTLDNTALDVSIQMDASIVNTFRMYPPSYVISLLILQGHAGDSTADFRVIWSGRVINAAWLGSECTFTCEPVATGMRRPGLRRNYQRGCPHVLFDLYSCRAAKEAYQATTIVTYPGNLLQVQAVGAPAWQTALGTAWYSHFQGGHIEYRTKNGKTESVSILAIDANWLMQLMGPVSPDLDMGQPVQMYLGCDHTMNAYGCLSHRPGTPQTDPSNGTTFYPSNNLLNFGGMPWIPLRNPTNNLSIFN